MDEEDSISKIINLPFMKGKKMTLDDALDLAPMAQEKQQVTVREDENDYQTAREQIHDAMGTLKTAIGEMAGLAFQAQHARAYEVLGQLIEKQVSTAVSLVDLQNKAQVETGPKTINNTLHISSADMLDMIKDRE